MMFRQELTVAFITVVSYSFASDIITVRSVSDESGEEIPFANIIIKDTGVVHTDANGLGRILLSECNGKNLSASTYGYQSEPFYISEDSGDTVCVRMREIPSLTPDTDMGALKKCKDFKIGRTKRNLRFFNNGYFNAPPSEDSARAKSSPYELGMRINAPEGKVNVLNSFGINILPKDSMLNQLDFTLYVYDVAGFQQSDSLCMPTPICKPIPIHFSIDCVDKKQREFRYDFLQPIVLPAQTVIVVDWDYCEKDGECTTVGKWLPVLVTKTGEWYSDGNPYREYNPDYVGKKKYSPFFWEFSQYILNE